MASPFLHSGVNMNKKLIGALITIVVVICGYLYASPYLALNNIKKAAEAGDTEKLSTYIDYPSVRESFKSQVKASVMKDMANSNSDGWEALGEMLAVAMVDKVVDAMVTPEGVTLMLQGKDIRDAIKQDLATEDVKQEQNVKFESSTRYLTINDFELTLKRLDTDKKLKVIMHRNGLSWKVTKLALDLDQNSVALDQESNLQDTSSEQVLEAKVQDRPTISQTVFNHSGAQVGKVMEFCYRDPCSVAQVKGFEILSQTPNDVDIELTLLGGSKGWEDESTEWNDATHTIQITCSIEKPTVRMEGQVTVVPLNKDLGVPGVLMSDAEIYAHACHGDFNGTLEEMTTNYGYNVHTD